ncbi:MAG: zinc-dependent alcohol dehydrogenase [Prolixibacteraceae bacterium]
MAEPIAVAAHAVNLSGIHPGESALVVGAGMVGTFVIQLLKIAGAEPVFALDTDAKKRELAVKAGAGFSFDPSDKSTADKIKKLTKNRGTDFGFEVVGKSKSVNTCIGNIRKGGTAVLVGNLSPEIQFPLQQVVTREIKVQGSCAINGEYEMVLDLLSSGKINADLILSAVAPLSEGAKWFHRLYNKEPGLNKVVLIPDKEFKPDK